MSDDLFPGFESHWLDTEVGRIFARSGGSGPPLLLLHGFPQSHVMWHRLAPALARHHRVVCMDLRGYGWSSAPRGDPRHQTYAKRAMGRDAVAVMEALGHVRFALAGHDRGARVAYRLALDHPGRLTRLALLDIVPTFAMWQRIRAGWTGAPHWAFLARPAPEPETEIGRDPVPYFEGLMARWSGAGTLEAFDPRALAAYRAGFNEPNRIHAFCEDYRAGATRDVEADEADLAEERRIRLPTLVLWGEGYLAKGSPSALPTLLEVWRESFAPEATGRSLPCGHFVAEEDPSGVLQGLEPFLAADR
jgi:haloacetate dehalogenase